MRWLPTEAARTLGRYARRASTTDFCAAHVSQSATTAMTSVFSIQPKSTGLNLSVGSMLLLVAVCGMAVTGAVTEADRIRLIVSLIAAAAVIMLWLGNYRLRARLVLDSQRRVLEV